MDEEVLNEDEITKEIELKEIEAEKEKRNSKKKKVHVKKKGIIVLILLIVLGIALGVGGYFGYKAYEKKTIKEIKNTYTTYMITSKDTKLYDKNHKAIGTIKKGFQLTLADVKIKSMKNRYLQTNDKDYYVYYKDLKAYNPAMEAVEETYYLPLGKEITSLKEVELYDGKNKVITLTKGLKNTEVVKRDKDNYYIRFLGKDLKVKQSKGIQELDIQKEIEGKAEHVSVIYYDKILPDCGSDDTCLYPASVKAHVRYMKENGYYFITKEDYLNYIQGYINLKDKAIFLAIGNPNETVDAIKEEIKTDIGKIEETDGIKLVVTNKTSTPQDDKNAVNCYQAKRYTIIDNYMKMAEGVDVPDNGKETSNNQGIAVINYHFFFDSGKGETCNESICLDAYKLREHLQWLNDNGYKTLTIHEYTDWMEGIIEIPDKSVLLTIDDGAMGTGAHNGNILIPTLEEYKAHATLFLITGWWGLENYQSPYLDVQSHTNNLHYEASCSDGRGKVACSDYTTVKNDLQESLNVLQDNTSFCFPFYSADRESIQAVQDLGFRVSFVGGSTKSRRSNNHYLIPRYPVMDDITLNEFIRMVS